MGSAAGMPWNAALMLMAGAAVLPLTACAGSTLGSGVGDRWLERSPYYAGRAAVPVDVSIGHLPIRYQAGSTQPGMFDPASGAGTSVDALLAEMNAYLDALGVTTPIRPVEPPRGTPPDVIFGCASDPLDDCPADDLREGQRLRMRLAVARPSGQWVAWAGHAAGEAGADLVLALTLEVSQYWPRQTDLRGSKEVELGTDHAVPLPWLTGLDVPVAVLQLTGALLDRDGRARRIGAEGMLARRTNLLLASVGARSLISDEDVDRLRDLRREDLPGQPLVWQVAIRTLAEELTGQPVRRADSTGR